MHNDILCVSTSREDCPVDGMDIDLNIIGADYIGDNEPEQIPDFFKYNFGSCLSFVPMPKSEEEIGNHCEGQLIVNKHAIRSYIEEWLDRYKEKVESTTIDTILEDSVNEGSRYSLRRTFGRDSFCDVVYFEYEILPVIDFLIKLYNRNDETPLYVVGCVDYHW